MAEAVRNWSPKRLVAVVAPFAWLLLLAVAVRALDKEWGGFHFNELDDALRRIGLWHVLTALALTGASLFCNASLDLVALRWLGKKLPGSQVIGTALIAGSFSMNGGGTILGGLPFALDF